MFHLFVGSEFRSFRPWMVTFALIIVASFDIDGVNLQFSIPVMIIGNYFFV